MKPIMQPQIPLLVLALPALLASQDPPQRCGKPGFAPNEAEFSGGREAVPHSWPWLVTIAPLASGGGIRCTGSLLTRNWVLAAAGCLQRRNTSAFSVEAGRHCLNCQEPALQQRRVDEIRIHSEFASNAHLHDLALLRVSESFLFNENVSQICLPQLPVPNNASCFVAGWHRAEGLHQQMLPVVPNSVCRNASHLKSDWITRDMLCAGYDRSGSYRCIDDYGAPFMCKSEVSGLWSLHGVLVGGGAEVCDNPKEPLVFARIREYVEWVAASL